MKPTILRILQEKPMHGYEIITKLEEKSHGMWRPSAGSIYPNLQLFEEQDLVTSKLENDKRIYALTDKGKEMAVKAETEHRSRWEEKGDNFKNFKEIKYIIFEIMDILKQLAPQNSDSTNEKVKKILTDTKEKLSSLIDSDK
jgi:DNA-binding PadR family transcriptional regulator